MEKYVAVYVSIAGTVLGVPKSIPAFLSGETSLSLRHSCRVEVSKLVSCCNLYRNEWRMLMYAIPHLRCRSIESVANP